MEAQCRRECKREEALQSNSYRYTILSYEVCFLPTRMDESARRVFQRWLGSFCGPALTFVLLCCVLSSTLVAQDWVKTGTSLGVDKVRLAVPDFKPSTGDPQNTALLKTFND